MLGDENLEKFFSKIDAAEFGISAGSKPASKNPKLAGSARDGNKDKPLKSQGGAEFCDGQPYFSGAQQDEILKFNAKPPFDAEKERLDTEQAHLKFNVRPSQSEPGVRQALAAFDAHPSQAPFDAERAQAKIENFMRDLLQNYVLCVSGAEFAFAEIEAYFTGADRNTYKRTSRAGEIFFHNFGFDISFRSVPQSGGGILVRSLRVLSGAELLAGGLPGFAGRLSGSEGDLSGSVGSGPLGHAAPLIQNGDFIAGPRKCMGKILNLQTRNLNFSLKRVPQIARAAGFSNRIRRGEIVNEANLDANTPSGAAGAAKLVNEPRRLTSEEFEAYLSTGCAAAKTYKKSLQRYED